MSSHKPKEYVDVAQRWREHAAAEDWWCIDEAFLSRDDREELLKILSEKVPTREWGDGLNKFEDLVHPSEAATPEGANAAQLARSLKRRKIFEEKTSVHPMIRPYTDPFVEAVQAARETLKKYGLEYEGLANTYLYQHPATKRWKQVPRNRAKLIVERSKELGSCNPDDFQWDRDNRKVKYQEWRNWTNRYPWRLCWTLQDIMEHDCITPFADIWHACNILKEYERTVFSKYIQPYSPPTPSGPINSNATQFSYAHICDAYRAALSIGISYEALKNKSFEPDAIRGINQLQATREGGKATASKAAQRREQILKVMYDLMAEKGWKKYELGSSWAASLASKRGYGTSPEANRKLWYKHWRKKWPEL